MKKIITAIDEELRKKLENSLQENVIINNILYPEGILEFLEKDTKIDIVILEDKIIEIKNIIPIIKEIKNKSKNIKIIILVEKKYEELKKYAKENFISYYYLKDKSYLYNLKKELEDIEENSQIELKKEIQALKELLLKKESKKNVSFIKDIKRKLLNKKQKNKETNKHILGVIGPSGVGKSVVTVNLANSFKKEYSKILVLDFDFLNNSLHTIYGVKKYPKKIEQKLKNNIIPISCSNDFIKKIKSFAIHINKKIDLISGIDIIFEKDKSKMNSKIQEILINLQKEYEMIIIDTSCECFFDINKAIMECSDNNIFVTDTNIIEIKKSKRLLDIYLEKWKIDKNKIYILFNKVNTFSIEEGILRNIFSDFFILGKIKYNKKYNLFINSNLSNKLIKNKIKEPYIKISKKILKIDTQDKENILKILKKKIKEA